jgi:hypothetical protein
VRSCLEKMMVFCDSALLGSSTGNRGKVHL